MATPTLMGNGLKSWLTVVSPMLIGIAGGGLGAYVSVQILQSRVVALETAHNDIEARMRQVESWRAGAPIEAEAVRTRQETIIDRQQSILDRLAIIDRHLLDHEEYTQKHIEEMGKRGR